VTLSAVVWHYQMVDLADRYRVIAFDHRGHGLSLAGEGGYGTGRLAADLAQALEQLELHGAVIVGHSMGGMVAQRFLVDFPEVARQRVSGVILMSTTAHTGSRVPGWERITRSTGPLLQRALRLGSNVPATLFSPTDLGFALTRIGFGKDPSPTHVDLNRKVVAAHSSLVLAELWAELTDFDIRADLADVDIPVLVVAGTHDNITPLFHNKEISRSIRDAELKVLEGGGHMLMLERRDEVNQVIADFAARVAPARPASARPARRARRS
jgi:3-oxoadipate enol-lactonase